MKIRYIDIKASDFDFIKEIYDYYIVNSTATYYTERISVDELKEFILTGHKKYKSFLIKVNNHLCGFCYLSQYKKRQAYDRTAEVSLYLKPEFTGQGIGKDILNYLEKVARKNGISVLIGIISGDNDRSIKLFERCGYEKCAHYKQVGEKFNKILDVVAYQKIIIKK
ncbi:MAG: N-acetyltransferase family protein [Bacteroidales bacterium]|jgi:phosphinothricin acetyltransferase|nr:N-acetyltransferase family protein [Bacteroidales bacterium]